MDKIKELEDELLKLKAAQTFGEQVSAIKVLTATDNEWDITGQMTVDGQHPFYDSITTYRVYTDKKISFGEIRIKCEVNGQRYPFSDSRYGITTITNHMFTGVDNNRNGNDFVEFSIGVFAGQVDGPPEFKLKVRFKTIDGEYMTVRRVK